jgi:hypothetical protein
LFCRLQKMRKRQRPCDNDVMTVGRDHQPTVIKQAAADATPAVHNTQV